MNSPDLILAEHALDVNVTLSSDEIEELKAEVVRISRANTSDREREEIEEARRELEPLIELLGKHFQYNRPNNEVELTTGAWESLWYDDATIDASEGFQRLNREKVFQVVYSSGSDSSSFYYNVSESKIRLFGLGLFKVRSFLRGNYTLIDQATPDTQGEARRNVIALEFAQNRAQLGGLKSGMDVVELTEKVISGEKDGFKIPGPKGITGELWNLYVDEDIRIAAGNQVNEEETLDLYILRKNGIVGAL